MSSIFISLMGFSEWWKTSSAQASEDYYKLRFDERELSELRSGFLSATARGKMRQRLKKVRKLTVVILGGCLFLSLLFFVPFVLLAGSSFYKHPPQIVGNPVAYCFGAFLLLWVSIFAYGIIRTAVMAQTFRRRVRADLRNGRVGSDAGRITIKSVRSQDSSRLEYWMNNTQYFIMSDAIGAEFNRQVTNGMVIVGGSTETDQSYRFYFLPESKMVLHYEPV